MKTTGTEKMTISQSLLSLDANTERLPQVTAYGETPDGLALELRADPAGVLDLPGLPNVLVAVHVGRSAKISCRRGGVNYTGSAAHGDVDIVPAGTPSRWEMHDQHDRTLLLGLPCSLLNTVAEQHGIDSRRLELRNRFQIRDAQLEYISWALKAEMESNYPSGRLYTESLSVAVASRLVCVYSSVSQRATEQKGGLDGRRLKQALTYIEDHLCDDLSLSRIASAAGISASHFKVRFRESTGVPVHQYVIQRRLERAKSLLMEGKLSIAQIALESGFSHQSHLARHLRRAAGLSPRVMKRLFADLSSR
jgi:AraC family transcriptional regulator